MWRVTGVTLPAVDVTAHKGRFGHVGVVAGSPGMGGASVLSSIAALRAGAGLVSLVGDVDVARPVEVMSVAPSGDLASLDALVVGPGLAAHEADDVRAFVRHQRKDANAHERTLWTVADAGALTMLDKGDAEVWTPHPGEAARMLGVSVSDVQRDRIAAAHKIAFLKGGVVVLKGHAPVVATGSRVFVVDGDAPALAVAGSGDVLAGIIGAGLGGAFGPGTVDAVVVASVYMHQRAGADISRGALAAEIALRVRDVVESARGA